MELVVFGYQIVPGRDEPMAFAASLEECQRVALHEREELRQNTSTCCRDIHAARLVSAVGEGEGKIEGASALGVPGERNRDLLLREEHLRARLRGDDRSTAPLPHHKGSFYACCHRYSASGIFS
jgi:hypothetical protein